MKLTRPVFMLLLGLLLLSPVLASPAKLPAKLPAKFAFFDAPPHTAATVSLVGINNSGQILGILSDGHRHGFLWNWTKSAPAEIPVTREMTNLLGMSQASWDTIPLGMNNTGQIVGYYMDQLYHEHGFLLTQGVYTTLDVPGSQRTVCVALNDQGQIVGNYEDAHGQEHGFLFSQGVYKTLKDSRSRYTRPCGINDRGQIVGYSALRNSSGGEDQWRGFLLDHGIYQTLVAPDAIDEMRCVGINNKGQIIGSYRDRKAAQHSRVDSRDGLAAFVLDHGVYTTIAPPKGAAGADIFLKGINDAGQIVGEYQGVSHRMRGFLMYH